MKHTAIVLAAGRGSRMKSDIPKQFLEIDGKPVLYYTLETMQQSFLDEVILVASKELLSYCQKEIVEKYGFSKVKKVVAGGAERYLSVYQGLLSCEGTDYVYVHDGARPFVSVDILEEARACVLEHPACVAGVPAKDTIKIADADGVVLQTPPRDQVWQVQTPQVFSYALLRSAYEALFAMEKMPAVTDDAMVVETATETKVNMFCASYENIKITTPEDLDVATVFLQKKNKNET